MFSLLAVSVALVTTLSSPTTARRLPRHGASDLPTCNDPDRDQLERLWLAHGTWHESMFNVRGMLSAAAWTLANVSRDYVDIKLQKLTSDSSCPHTTTTTTATSDHGLLCPTYDVINYDPNRVPTTLFEKACSCESCSPLVQGVPAEERQRRRRNSGARRGSGGDHSAASVLGCHPVYYPVKVLRRVNCVDNVFIYRTVMEPLAVSCACDHVSRDNDFRERALHNLP